MTQQDRDMLAEEVARRLNAATAEYYNALATINGPVIAMLERLGPAGDHPAAHLKDYLAMHPLSSVQMRDLVILGEIWDALRESRPDLGLVEWADFLAEAHRASFAALKQHQDILARIRTDIAAHVKEVNSGPGVVARSEHEVDDGETTST